MVAARELRREMAENTLCKTCSASEVSAFAMLWAFPVAI